MVGATRLHFRRGSAKREKERLEGRKTGREREGPRKWEMGLRRAASESLLEDKQREIEGESGWRTRTREKAFLSLSLTGPRAQSLNFFKEGKYPFYPPF